MLPLGSFIESIPDWVRCHLVDEVVCKRRSDENISGTYGHRVDGASNWLFPRQVAHKAFVSFRMPCFGALGTHGEQHRLRAGYCDDSSSQDAHQAVMHPV